MSGPTTCNKSIQSCAEQERILNYVACRASLRITECLRITNRDRRRIVDKSERRFIKQKCVAEDTHMNNICIDRFDGLGGEKYDEIDSICVHKLQSGFGIIIIHGSKHPNIHFYELTELLSAHSHQLRAYEFHFPSAPPVSNKNRDD